jgi:hypothetical protein
LLLRQRCIGRVANDRYADIFRLNSTMDHFRQVPSPIVGKTFRQIPRVSVSAKAAWGSGVDFVTELGDHGAPQHQQPRSFGSQ